jgi:hypothetical protein
MLSISLSGIGRDFNLVDIPVLSKMEWTSIVPVIDFTLIIHLFWNTHNFQSFCIWG